MTLLVLLIGCTELGRPADQEWFHRHLQAKGFRLAPCHAPPLVPALERYPGWISTHCIDAQPPLGDTHRFWFLLYSDKDAPTYTLWRMVPAGRTTGSGNLLVVSDHMDANLFAELGDIQMIERANEWHHAGIPSRLWSHWLH